MSKYGLAGVCGLLFALLSSPVQGGGAVSQQIINPGGGSSPTDGIMVFIGSNSQVQIVGYSNLTGSPGIYPQMFSGCTTSGCTSYGTPVSGSMYNSVVLRLEPASGGTARIYANNDNGIAGSQPFNQTAQSAITGSGTGAAPYQVVTTLNPPGGDSGITVVLTDTYIFPDPYFSRAIDVTGLPAGEQAKLYWYIDTYLAGGDQGVGTSQTNASNTSGIPDFVGVSKPGVLQGIQAAAGMPLWDHYFSGYWSNPTNTYIPSAAGDLPDIIDTAYQDNGIAVQWNIPLGQTSFSVKTGQTFGGTALVSESYLPDSIFVGGSSTLEFTFQNFDTGDALNGAGASYALPAGVRLVSNTPLSNTCLGSGVTVPGGQIVFTNVSLMTAVAVGTPATCTVSFTVTSNVPGSHIGAITPASQLLSTATSGRERLTVRAGGNAVTTTDIPTLNHWHLALLAVLIGFTGLLMRRRLDG